MDSYHFIDVAKPHIASWPCSKMMF